MTTALLKALDEIKFTIPLQVLQVAFRDDFHNWRGAPVSLDHQIMTKIIKPRVLIDCNLVGGTMAAISLEGINPKYRDLSVIIYEIPARLTDHKEIVSVLSVGYITFGNTIGATSQGYGAIMDPGCGSEALAAGQKLLNSYQDIPNISNASVELMGANTVLIRDQVRTIGAYMIRCILSNDANLSNINPRSYPAFSKACILAVKSYIYNKLLVMIDQAYLSGGQDLGAFKSYIETLSDSEEMYQTHLAEVLRKTFFINDGMSHTRFLRSMVSSGL